MKKIAIMFCAALCVLFAGDASANACYNPQQFEAEQGIRIHSELMVIGLTCMKMPQGAGLYKEYQAFTQKNQDLISMYENEMIAHFREEGAKNPEKKLHTLRTTLANKISQHAIQMSTSSFCQHFGPRIDQALAMDHDKLRRWAQHVWPQTPSIEPMCKL
ncbi:MAG: hypothetical protein GC185_05880 [Alphaproteobacteria bacterium]|nr:hypothetical protein [Alphaproteobacteria bacterium]